MEAALPLHAGFLFKKSRNDINAALKSFCDGGEKYLSARQNQAGISIPLLSRTLISHDWHLCRVVWGGQPGSTRLKAEKLSTNSMK